MEDTVTGEEPIETAEKETATISMESISIDESAETKEITIGDVKHKLVELDGEDPGQFLHNFFHLAIPTLHPGIHDLQRRTDTHFSHIFEASLQQGDKRKRVVFKVMKYDPFSESEQERVDREQERVDHFMREAKIHKAVSDHPLNQQKSRVTRVYGFGSFTDAYYTGAWGDKKEYRPLHYIVTEFLEDRSLEEVLAKNGRPLEERAGMARGIAEGLDITHEAGYVHGDVKPKNAVWSAKTREVKLMDFGIAREIGAEIPDNVVVGTPDYMSPEMLSTWDADPRMDIFSFGVMIYNMLEGMHPYAGKCTRTESIIWCTIHNKIIFPRNKEGIKTGLADVAVKCLAQDPNRRYQNMGQVIEAIDSCKF